MAALSRPLAERNAQAHAGKNGRRVVSAFIATAFAQNDADAARRQWRAVADRLRPKMAKLAAFMDDAEVDVLAYMSFPAPHRVKLHATDPLERLDGEIERSTEVVGIFRNEDAIVRLVGAILLEQNDEWAVQRSRYMTLEPKAGAAKRSPPSAMIQPSPACRTWRPEDAAHIGAPAGQRSAHHLSGHDRRLDERQLAFPLAGARMLRALPKREACRSPTHRHDDETDGGCGDRSPPEHVEAGTGSQDLPLTAARSTRNCCAA